MKYYYSIRCHFCGKFISIKNNKAKHHFIPDNEFGPEENYWICFKCQ